MCIRDRPYGRITSWPESDATEIRVQGFAGWKAGMTHVLMRDTNPNSTSAGQEVRKAVTVVEVPPMKVLAVRGYHMTPYGCKPQEKLGLVPMKVQQAFILASLTRLAESAMLKKDESLPSVLVEFL